MGNLNGWEIILLALLALFIFGPDRLPQVISDAVRLLRRVRSMARDATDGLSRELGTQVTLEDLNPKTFIRKHVLSDEEQAALRRPLDDLARDLRSAESEVRRAADLDATTRPAESAEDGPRRHRTDPDAT